MAELKSPKQGAKISDTNEEKRRKWKAKQAWKRPRLDLEELIRPHREYISHLTHDDLANCKFKPLLDPYKNLKESSTSQYFVAEGTETVRVLLQQSKSIEIESVLVKPSVLFQDPVKLVEDVARARVRCFVAEESTISSIAGFPVKRGCLATGVAPRDRDAAWLFHHLYTMKEKSPRILALDGVSDTANLGSMLRTASAFGIHAVVLSRDCCDAWYRRSIRVSMGHVFRVPTVRVDSLSGFLLELRDKGVSTYASAIDGDTQLLEKMAPGSVNQGWCCVMGNEANGVSLECRKACDYSIRIGMEPGVDSLSVPIATGILLHGLKERETSP